MNRFYRQAEQSRSAERLCFVCVVYMLKLIVIDGRNVLIIRFENILQDAFPIEIFEQDSALSPIDVADHWHDCFELLYMLEGEAVQWVNGRKLTLHPEDILLLHSGDIHATVCDSRRHTRIFVLKFMPSVLDARYTQPYAPIHLAGFINATPEERRPLCEAHADFVRPRLEAIATEKKAQQPGADLYIRSYILLLAGYFVRQGLIRTLSDAASETSPYKPLSSINQMIQYMEERYSEDVSLRDIARLTHMNYAYASRYFKKLTGRNFKQYLDYIRVSEATRLLLYTPDSITQIAAKCGFSCSQAMARTYARMTGQPPSALRRQCWEHQESKKVLHFGI